VSQCPICVHPRRAEIEKALGASLSYFGIAAKYLPHTRLGPDVAMAHFAEHLTPERAAELEAHRQRHRKEQNRRLRRLRDGS
jgi:hypothetical protein